MQIHRFQSIVEQDPANMNDIQSIDY
jgi:hypothetical protein